MHCTGVAAHVLLVAKTGDLASSNYSVHTCDSHNESREDRQYKIMGRSRIKKMLVQQMPPALPSDHGAVVGGVHGGNAQLQPPGWQGTL